MTQYISSKEIDTVVQLAITMKKPVLVEGDAGTGKTALAKASAEKLDAKLIRIQCYEGISKEDVFCEFNYKKQLLRIQMNHLRDKEVSEIEENIFSEEYLIPKGLMQFLREKRAVLLIDEIDKADEEFEAFLLEFLEEKQLTINEINKTIQNENELFLVFITSNNYRELSEALKRRCIYLYLDYPSPSRELEIISLHCQDNFNEKLAREVVEVVQKLRAEDLKKKPSISETIEFYRSLLILNKAEIDKETLKNCLNILLKYKEDIEKVSVDEILPRKEEKEEKREEEQETETGEKSESSQETESVSDEEPEPEPSRQTTIDDLMKWR